jgi:Ca2+-binding RTX toxin-like protein
VARRDLPRRLLVLIVAVATTALATIDTRADAATVTGENGVITYNGDTGTNLLTVWSNSTWYFFPDAATTVDGDGACQDEFHDPQNPMLDHSAQCPVVGANAMVLDLSDGNDHLEIQDTASPPGIPPGTLQTLDAVGGDGNDSLKGGVGPETLDGGPGNDAPFDNGDSLAWVGIDGGGGNDDLSGGTGYDLVAGGDGNDQLDFGGADHSLGSDTLDGGPGDDQLSGGPPRQNQDSDLLEGGDGIDTADFTQRAAPLKIDLDGTADDGESGEHDNVEPDVEDVTGGSDDDTLTGSGAANLLDGRDGNDRIGGAAGDDLLDGGANSSGSDTLNGGDGRDMLYGRAGDDSLGGDDGDDALAGGGGTDKLDGDNGNDSLEGGAGGDALDGGPGDDVVNGAEPNLIGADGSDDLAGGPGSDSLLGDDGNDVLDGGPGPDRMSGGAGRDTADYESRASRVTVTLDGVANDGEAGERDNVLPNIEVVLGGTLGDDLTGDGDANRLDGGAGEDLLIGNRGRDLLEGGRAPDLVEARDGNADQLNCGADGDLAIVDRNDTVRDCKWIDRGGKRRLVVARSALARPVQGELGLRLPEGHRFFDLDNAVKIPIASTVDPEDGTVQLATARNSAGARQQIVVSQGVFSVRQDAGKRPVTELRLAGRLRACTRSAEARRAPTDAPLRRLYTQVDKRKRGRYRVRGRYSVGAAFGTAWLTEDRCDGTLTRVDSGAVRVRDRTRDTTVTVRAGESYLARAR